MDFGALCELLEITETESDEPLVKGSFVRHDGRLGTATMNPDHDNDIKIEWADDGSESGWIKAHKVEVVRLEPGVGREAFAAACTRHPERTAKMHAGLPVYEAVLEARIGAVWKWADTVADGELGTAELSRLADRVMGSSDDTDERKFEEVCEALGLDARGEEVTIGEEGFAAACRSLVSGWFATLRLDLLEERSCIADLCACCGL